MSRITMADVKRANARYHRERGEDWSYFDRKTSRFFGGDKFTGPYVGLGGVFFVQKNKAGINIKRVRPSGAVESVSEFIGHEFRSTESARNVAKALAKGVPAARSSSENPPRRAPKRRSHR